MRSEIANFTYFLRCVLQVHLSFASRSIYPHIALTISTISRGGVTNNVSCYMLKPDCWPWPPSPPFEKWFTSAGKEYIKTRTCIWFLKPSMYHTAKKYIHSSTLLGARVRQICLILLEKGTVYTTMYSTAIEKVTTLRTGKIPDFSRRNWGHYVEQMHIY